MSRIDLDYRTMPSRTFRWGVAIPEGSQYVVRFWFKTRRAAENYAQNVIVILGPVAICRWE